MEIAAILFSLTALIVSLFSMRKLSVPIQVDVHIPEQQIQVVEVLKVLESKVEETLSSERELIASNDQSRHAWKNQTGIPLNETKYTPSHGSKPPIAGPMQRPAGFAR